MSSIQSQMDGETHIGYSVKICLFEDQIRKLPYGTVSTNRQMKKVRDFVNFVTPIYSVWWMSCSSATDSPWNDLMLFHSLLRYADAHLQISKSAITAFKRQLWYLTEEMVPPALWSSKVPPAERRALADRLLAIKPATYVLKPQHRFGTGFGKPKFPESLSITTTLADLVGVDSYVWCSFKMRRLSQDTILSKKP